MMYVMPGRRVVANTGGPLSPAEIDQQHRRFRTSRVAGLAMLVPFSLLFFIRVTSIPVVVGCGVLFAMLFGLVAATARCVRCGAFTPTYRWQGEHCRRCGVSLYKSVADVVKPSTDARRSLR